MDNDQARKLVALHDNADRALLNLRNANSMATDDPRAPELLSEAGDAYAEAMTALFGEHEQVVRPLVKASAAGTEDQKVTTEKIDGGPLPEPPAQPSGSAPGAEDPATGGSQVQPEAERGTAAEEREQPADAPSAPETGEDGSGEGQSAPSA